MIWNDLSPEQKVSNWRELRLQIIDLTDSEQLDAVALFFAKVPLHNRVIDFYTPDSWPTPWEIMYDNLFCTSSLSLMMYYTFKIINKNTCIKLILVDDTNNRYLLPIINDTCILNYELGKVTRLADINDTIKIIAEYTDQHIKQFS